MNIKVSFAMLEDCPNLGFISAKSKAAEILSQKGGK